MLVYGSFNKSVCKILKCHNRWDCGPVYSHPPTTGPVLEFRLSSPVCVNTGWDKWQWWCDLDVLFYRTVLCKGYTIAESPFSILNWAWVSFTFASIHCFSKTWMARDLNNLWMQLVVQGVWIDGKQTTLFLLQKILNKLKKTYLIITCLFFCFKALISFDLPVETAIC